MKQPDNSEHLHCYPELLENTQTPATWHSTIWSYDGLEIPAWTLPLGPDITATCIQFPFDHLALGLSRFCVGLWCPSGRFANTRGGGCLCLGSCSSCCAQCCLFQEGAPGGATQTARAGLKWSLRLSFIPPHPLPTLPKKHRSVQIAGPFPRHWVHRGFGKPVPESCFSPLVLTLTLF